MDPARPSAGLQRVLAPAGLAAALALLWAAPALADQGPSAQTSADQGPAAQGPQAKGAPAQGVLIRGPDGASVVLSATDLSNLPRTTVDLVLGGKTIHYEGVRMDLLLSRVGAPLGGSLRGPAMADVAVVKASDGYRVVFGLADLDPAFRSEPVILADRADARPLGSEGPLRLVVGGDLRPARSVRSVVEIDVERLP